MHALTTEQKSTAATIRAHVGATVGAGLVPARVGRPQGSPLQEAPRFVVTLDAPLTASSEPTRIPIAITGKWVRDGNDFSITLGDLNEIVRNFNQRRNGEINVDYDHASEMPEVAAGGPVPSAGRIVKLEEPRPLVTPHPPSFVGHPLPKGEGKNPINHFGNPLPTGEVKNSINHFDNPLPTGEGKNSIKHFDNPLPKGEGGNPPAGGEPGLRPPKGYGPQAGEGSRWILYGNYEPTPRARKLIESREYRYISPAINWAGRDKRTGKMTGTTLTSVALTNRPFLEELPQIRLSDPAYQLVDVGDVHVDTSLGVNDGVRESKTVSANPNPGSSPKPESRNPNPVSKGETMKQVKLSVQDGQIKVTHDDFPDGYFADPRDVRQCMEDLGGESGAPDYLEPALASEIESLAGLAGRPESAGASATLSECVAEIRRRLETGREISLTEASALLSEAEAGGKTISAADYFRSRVEQELDEAVKRGKVLPRQREDWRKIALSDFPTFRKIVAEQKPQVPLRPVGLAGSGPEDAQTQVKLLAEQRMRERQISFGQALSEIGREQPELVHQYRRAVSA
jgi:Mu-like prophage I protein